jgi:hypothetical protein
MDIPISFIWIIILFDAVLKYDDGAKFWGYVGLFSYVRKVGRLVLSRTSCYLVHASSADGLDRTWDLLNTRLQPVQYICGADIYKHWPGSGIILDESRGSTHERGSRHNTTVEQRSSWILKALKYASCDCELRVSLVCPCSSCIFTSSLWKLLSCQ